MLKFIKWCVKTVLVLTGILPLFRCSSGYREKDGKITFNGKEITDKNFVVLSDEFAKDSTTAWYKQYPFRYADVATFEAVDEHYARDIGKVYFCDEYREGQNYYLTKKQTILEVKDADPALFVSLKNGYGKDRSHVWFKGIAFTVKDVASFTSIDNNFAKDNVHAYLNRKPIAGSDGKSFELLDRNYARDRVHIYYYGYTGEGQHNICILPVHRQYFQVIDYRYSKDDVSVFFLGFKISGADGATFILLTDDYSKDGKTVYFQSKKSKGQIRTALLFLKKMVLSAMTLFLRKTETQFL